MHTQREGRRGWPSADILQVTPPISGRARRETDCGSDPSLSPPRELEEPSRQASLVWICSTRRRHSCRGPKGPFGPEGPFGPGGALRARRAFLERKRNEAGPSDSLREAAILAERGGCGEPRLSQKLAASRPTCCSCSRALFHRVTKLCRGVRQWVCESGTPTLPPQFPGLA